MGGGKGKDDFCEEAQVVFVLRSFGDLLHPELPVAVNSIEPKREERTQALGNPMT